MYRKGKWWVVCDVCGFKFYNDEVQERWDGVLVCTKDFETRHPQDFGRSIDDRQTVPYVNQEPADVFINVPYIETE